MEGGLH